MIIKNINIISFGGLKNLSLSLESGLNCIYGENEKGKSTLLSFIKMMFYGSERGSSQLSKNIRKKYTPWNGDQMAGSIDFELAGRTYRLEREFRSSNSTDKVFLTDLSLGEKQPAEGDIGNRLFGISAAAFERSIFIGQLGFPESNTEAEGEINAKLSNLVSTGDEGISLNKVTECIAKERYSLMGKTARSGEYNKLKANLSTLEERYSLSVAAQSKYLEGKEKLLQHSKETAQMESHLKELKHLLSKEEDIKNAQKLQELLDTKAELERLKAQLVLTDGSPADDAYLRNLNFCISKYNAALSGLEDKKREQELIKTNLEDLKNAPSLSIDETPEKLSEQLKELDLKLCDTNQKISQAQSQIEELSAQSSKTPQKPVNIPLLVIGVVLLGLCFINPIIFGIFGVLAVALSFILKPADKKRIESTFKQISQLEELLAAHRTLAEDLTAETVRKKSRLDALNLAKQSNGSVIEAQAAKLTECENKIAELELIKDREEEQLKATLQLFGNAQLEQLDTALDTLKNAGEQQKELKLKINALLGVLNNISYEDAREKLAKLSTRPQDFSEDFGRLKVELEELTAQINLRKNQEYNLAHDLKSIISSADTPQLLERQIGEIKAKMSAEESFCSSADIAIEVLNESFAELRQNYGSKLEKTAGEIFKGLTLGKYSGLTVSKAFAINVLQDNLLSKEAEYLSSGTFDQAYLSFRLAVARLISEKQALPIFLDDSLAQYDDNRAKATLEFLKTYCQSSQGLLFTCHNYVKTLTENMECNIIVL